MVSPKIVPTDRIPHDEIDPDALKVVRRLRRFGHEAYLVGGCVRDLLLGAHPKDFDVITSARPRQVRRIFSNSRVIGRRFRLVHVIFGQNIVEVSTFRADPGQFAEERAEAEAAAAAELELAGAEGEPTEPGVEPAAVPAVAAVEPAPASPEPTPSAPLAVGEEPAAGEEPVPDELADEEAPADEPLAADEPADEERGPPPARRGRVVDDEEELVEYRRGRRRVRPPRPEFDGNNVFGTPEEDARRRDFTINALFYDPERRELIDYVEGLRDVERGLVASIRDPDVSFVEDPVRMIRAVRFAAKLGFKIDDQALEGIKKHRGLLESTSQRRLLEEIFKILKGSHAQASIERMGETGILESLLPEVHEWLAVDATLPAAPAAPVPLDSTITTPAAVPSLETPAPEPAPAPAAVPSLDAPPPPVAVPAPAPVLVPAATTAAPGTVYGLPAVVGAPAPGLLPPPARPIKLRPLDRWEPPREALDAYLRVTWERAPKEGANDWVEDPHEEVVDAIFEAAAFARDVSLERFGLVQRVGLVSERSRARAVLKILKINDLVDETIGPSRRPPPQGRGNGGPRPARPARPAAPPSPPPAGGPKTRRELLQRYLESLDRLTAEKVPVTTALQLSALYAPLLKTAIEDQRNDNPEVIVDEILRPIALRHSLARRDRDRVKLLVLAVRRLLRGEGPAGRRRRRGGAHKLLGRDYFQEALVLLWIHARATGEGMDQFHAWKRRALELARTRSPHDRRHDQDDDDGDFGDDGPDEVGREPLEDQSAIRRD